ncbi:alpha/beta fold hydrolase [Polaromonas sp.]|uniref:alpha/beta fold hydrolase n=1 Tax=Polaromonas sp. TaxID=1869339 RepID=UPI001A33B48E|nr:alpha/beta fold hydrolase [Burkholderiales bacterium]
MLKPLPPRTARLLGCSPTPAWPEPAWVSTARNSLMAYRRLGPATGEPWLVLHGGPGGGCQPDLLQVFQPGRHQVILPDQRGAGLSRPRGRSAGNHTDQLVADLECLRLELGIERWSLLAGSWGTVLALCYAARYPQRVARLVLRGAFGLCLAEIRGLLHPHPIRERAVAHHSDWPCAPLSGMPRVLAKMEQVLQVGAPRAATVRLIRCWNLLEQGAALHGMWRSLVHAASLREPLLASSIRRSWAQLRRKRRQAEAGLNRPGIRSADRRGWQKFRIQSHYLRHKGFLRPGDLDRAVGTLARHGLPSDWVHGQFDAVCPPGNSRQWVGQSQALQPGLARAHWPVAGHLAGEPAMRAALRRAVKNQPVMA